MSITTKVIEVSGEKIESLVLAENELQLLNKSFTKIEEFNEQWNKKLTLTTKNKIEYSDIKSITKEDSEDEVVVNYSGSLGISKTIKIQFTYEQDREDFYSFLQEQKGFTKSEERLSSLQASKSLLISLAIVTAVSIFAYFQAVEVASPDFIENDDTGRSARKARFFHSIVRFLGPNGVLLVALALMGFIGYQIWKRYKNPPLQLKFVRN